MQALDKVYGKKIVSDGPVAHILKRKPESAEISLRTARKLKTSDGGAVRVACLHLYYEIIVT
jgi:endonuclease/exonuclease/phosphatase family metal-dependent hydrolase